MVIKKESFFLCNYLLVLACIEHLLSHASQSQRVLHEIEVFNIANKKSFIDQKTFILHVFCCWIQHSIGFFLAYFAFLVLRIEDALNSCYHATLVKTTMRFLDFLNVNDALSKMIIPTCYKNSYFIIVQLLNLATLTFSWISDTYLWEIFIHFHFQPSRLYAIDKIYFYYSLVFLMIRTCAMFFRASSIVEQSQKPLQITRSIPNEGWLLEIERFSDQIRIECNALSGMNVFYFRIGWDNFFVFTRLTTVQYNRS